MGATFTVTTPDIIWLGPECAISVGRYVSAGGATGGDIPSGIGFVKEVVLTPTGAAVATNQSAYNETLPLAGSTPVTIVTDADQGGSYLFVGTL